MTNNFHQSIVYTYLLTRLTQKEFTIMFFRTRICLPLFYLSCIQLMPSSAKPQPQLCWLAELALISANPATPATLPPTPGKVYLVAGAKEIITVEYSKQ